MKNNMYSAKKISYCPLGVHDLDMVGVRDLAALIRAVAREGGPPRQRWGEAIGGGLVVAKGERAVHP